MDSGLLRDEGAVRRAAVALLVTLGIPRRRAVGFTMKVPLDGLGGGPFVDQRSTLLQAVLVLNSFEGTKLDSVRILREGRRLRFWRHPCRGSGLVHAGE